MVPRGRVGPPPAFSGLRPAQSHLTDSMYLSAVLLTTFTPFIGSIMEADRGTGVCLRTPYRTQMGCLVHLVS